MLYDLKVADFLTELASDSPAPGGGSVAALAGALTASLIAMVGRISTKNEEAQARIQEIVQNADKLSAELKELIQKDTQAFNEVMAAFKMPKGTDEEKAARSNAIQSGYKEAALVPLQVMEKAVEAMELASEIAEIGNQNAVTDAGVAGLMGLASAQGAAYNVQVNLLSIKDEEFKREKADRLSQTLMKAKNLACEIENIVQKAVGV